MTSTVPADRPVVRRLPDFDAATPAPTERPHPAHARPDPARPDGQPHAAPARTGHGMRPPADQARLHAHLVLRHILEVLDGRRPAAHLAGRVSEPVLRYLTLAAGRLDQPRYPGARAGHPAARRAPTVERARGAGLRSMRICYPTERVAEVSVVWRYQGRYRALAARFELPTDSEDQRMAGIAEPRWRCTALRIG